MSSRPRPPQSFPLDVINVDRTSALPLRLQIFRHIAAMIRTRSLAAGSALPSTRELADDLGVGRNTVVAAYEQLATEGYLVSRLGARAIVADLPPEVTDPSPAADPVNCRSLSRSGRLLISQPVHHGAPRHYTFHPGIPDVAGFPFGIWARLLARRAKFFGAELFGTYHVTGLPELQAAIAGYLASARGVTVAPQRIIVTTGSQAAFDLLGRLLLDPGDTVWMEEPGYYAARAAFVIAGARIEPLRVDGEGWHLEPPARAPRLVYLTPACQHPLGITMRMEQRLRILRLAEQTDSWIIEDDFDGEYRSQGRPVAALRSMDHSGRIIYVGTFTKLLFPALRIGFIALPESFPDGIVRALGTTGQFAPLLLQAALADFIAEGHLSRHLKRMRRVYEERRQRFHDLCGRHLGQRLRLLPAEAGIQAVGELVPGPSDTEISGEAARLGVNTQPLSRYYHSTTPRQGLVLGYAACNQAQMERGVQLLGEAFARQAAAGAQGSPA